MGLWNTRLYSVHLISDCTDRKPKFGKILEKRQIWSECVSAASCSWVAPLSQPTSSGSTTVCRRESKWIMLAKRARGSFLKPRTLRPCGKFQGVCELSNTVSKTLDRSHKVTSSCSEDKSVCVSILVCRITLWNPSISSHAVLIKWLRCFIRFLPPGQFC